MTYRTDISNNLVHFTKGIDSEGAFKNLWSIISNEIIYGSDNLIKGKHKCVCFSEAPIDLIKSGLVNMDNFSRYSPFGILVSKKWLFSKGGRPVIYQPEKQYSDLFDKNKWRHVTYNPILKPPIDFTWEREWRIQTNELEIDSENYAIIVPDSDSANNLVSTYMNEQDYDIEQYKMLIGDIAELYRSPFPWKIYHLND
ncbi:MAG: hypothetical protein DRI75_07945 [Bacteroidetes bacterium]|nr:MAG: hypothetical protein DRI75_07945 [Bacteroidota bacterium]